MPYQEAHHAKQSFKEEYLMLLEKFDLKYDNRYLFDFFDAEKDWNTFQNKTAKRFLSFVLKT